MQKRGQVTIFIVVAVMILFVSAGFFVFKNYFVTEELKAEGKGLPVAVVQVTVESCLERTAKDALIIVGKQGGYYRAPFYSEYFFGSEVPYYIHHQKMLFPELRELENQLSIAVINTIPPCLDDLVTFFDREGVVINYEIKGVDTTIGDTKVSLLANIPITVSLREEQEIETRLDTFSTEIAFKYKQFYDYSKMIFELQRNEPSSFSIGGISDLAHRYNFQYEIISPKLILSERENSGTPSLQPLIDNDHNKVLISLVSNDFFNEPYYYTFGILFDLDYETIFSNDAALQEEMRREVEVALTES